jgi:hypothetical protein
VDLDPIDFDHEPRSCERSRRHSRRCGVKTEEWRRHFWNVSHEVRRDIQAGLRSEEAAVLIRIFERHLERERDEERRGGRCGRDRDDDESRSRLHKRHRHYAAGIAVLMDLFRDNPVLNDSQLCQLRAAIRALERDLRGSRCGDEEAREELLALASIRLTNAVIRFKRSESAADFREIRISIELLERAVEHRASLADPARRQTVLEIRHLIRKHLRDRVGHEIESALR